QISPATRTEAVLTITQNPGNARQGYTTFYQFGRKDALPGTDAIAQGSYSFDNTSGGRSLGHAIQHPENMFINAGTAGSYQWDWCNATYDNLWSADNTVTGLNDNAVVKTIYDPCPAGFHMPASNAFTGFTTTGNNSVTRSECNVSGAWDYGWNFNNKIFSPDATVYFPASGYRIYGSGLLNRVGFNGFSWSAVPGGTNSGCAPTFSQTSMEPQNYYERSIGFSVRPVAEPKTRVTPRLPGSTEEDWSSNEDLDAGDIDI
ncbi:MAG: hypothetical protein ACFNOO_08260, partial [Segatella oulorum]